jgi:hypothetical protein
MKELFDEAKKNYLDFLGEIERITEDQFKSLSENKLFEKENDLEKELLEKYLKFKRCLLEYKTTIEKYWDYKKEEFSPFNILINKKFKK